ncbi:hypothetical protein F4820DRAFT_419618 [Hypoxylon rubiginosum]|uniref:Uncharacterized protein n=1 Tax=Hypoxylon rubiginosum TaxID=110542 RepID=A0ACB9Z3C0_9PEZI|nr:hypothetical protein F4820DRAFT_419618 [Hypoxylon rubiginosum]
MCAPFCLCLLRGVYGYMTFVFMACRSSVQARHCCSAINNHTAQSSLFSLVPIVSDFAFDSLSEQYNSLQTNSLSRTCSAWRQRPCCHTPTPSYPCLDSNPVANELPASGLVSDSSPQRGVEVVISFQVGV